MKKLFALLLVLSCLFLTACNNGPDDSTLGTGTGTGSTSNTQNQAQPNELELKDTIVGHYTRDFINLPSRVVYEQGGTTYYYSKADGKAYVYCFDPLCKHDNEYCLANPDFGFHFGYTFFINNRFYYHTGYGQIKSFSFDGTDKKIEYDTDYGISTNPWGHCMAFGSYIYIDLRSYASEDGIAHTLRFNVETGEMVDLTEKTGNYIYPTFFYNGMLYGYDQGSGYLKVDLDLNSCEEIERIPYSNNFSGSRFLGSGWDDEGCCYTRIYDMKTETMETYEISGLTTDGSLVRLYTDENYFYFYKYEQILIGEVWSRGELKPAYKYNDGSIYRVNHDGTGLVCIYEAQEDFTITGQELLIVGDQLLIEAKNGRIRDNVSETWNNGLWVGTIGADGKISELKPVEVVE